MKRTTASLLTGALAAGTFAALATITPSIASATACGTTTVTNEDAQGWNIPSFVRGTGSASFQPAPDNLVLNAPLSSTKNSKVTIAYPIAGGVLLADQTAQSNYALVSQRFDGQPNTTATGSATYEMVVDPDGAGPLTSTTLVYEDYYQAANPNTWWSTQPLANIPDRSGHGRADWGTLDEISLAYPNAVITSFGVNLNALPNGDPAKVSVDSVTFGCNTFEFDLANQGPTAVINAEDDNGDTDYRTYFLSGVGSTDPDGDPLTYAWSITGGSLAAPITDTRGEFTVTFPNGPGTYVVKLTVSDGALTSTVSRSIVVTPPSNTSTGVKLPNTGASVIGLAALTGAAVVAGGAGTVITRRRRSDSAV